MCDFGWVYVRDSGDDIAQGKTAQYEREEIKEQGLLSYIGSWSHPESLHLGYLSEKIFPSD